MRKSLRSMLRDSCGATPREYGVIGLLIAFAVVVGGKTAGPKFSAAVNNVQGQLVLALSGSGSGLSKAPAALQSYPRQTVARQVEVDNTPTSDISKKADGGERDPR